MAKSLADKLAEQIVANHALARKCENYDKVVEANTKLAIENQSLRTNLAAERAKNAAAK